MKTVKEVSKLTGVSIRTLHYYDAIGLLHPVEMTESGYRLYDDTALERLQQILLFRELQFPLKEIKEILDSPNFDRNKALEQQITLLELKKEHLENLILFARGICMIGVKKMDFSVFDTRKMDEYAKQAKEAWGHTEAYQEFEKRSKNWTKEKDKQAEAAFMELFADFGRLKGKEPSDKEVQEKVREMQDFITERFYTCTPQILKYLGDMYAGGGSMTENIDKAAGEGTAQFCAEAIEVYCRDRD